MNLLIFLINFFIHSQTNEINNISTNTLAYKSPVINIVYPWEGKDIGGVSNTFIFGNVVPYVSTITVNGKVVNVYKTGGFIAYVPVDRGEFRFVVCAQNNYEVSCTTRSVVNGKNTDNKKLFEILISTSNYIMRGDSFFINIKAEPSSNIYYEIGDICNGFLVEEKKGYYSSYCMIPSTFKKKTLNLLLKYKDGRYNGEKMIYENFINVIDKKYVIETTTDNVVIKNETGGYLLFIPENVKLVSDRKEGNRYRVEFDEMKLWVDEDKVVLKGFLNKKIKNETGTIRFIKQDDTKTVARIYVSEKVPYMVYEEDDKLYLKLFYTNLRTNWVVYDSNDKYINNVSFRQDNTNTVLFIFKFNEVQSFWGYDIKYSSDSYMNIEFKFKPKIEYSSIQPLRGLKIVIDPGHSYRINPPYDGAVGPLGSFEWDINLKIALKLKERLSNLGANVFMTRYTNDEKEQVPLSERPKIAKRLDADLFISIHNNAIPDGEDPYSKPRGFQIYYYHLHSKKLADFIHKQYIKNISLPDEGVRFGDYHVLRLTSMPAVLIENAYMILPEHEELLLSDDFRDTLVKTISEGIVGFIYDR